MTQPALHLLPLNDLSYALVMLFNLFVNLINFIIVNCGNVLVQLGFDLSNGVTDTLESSLVLTYSEKHMGLYTQSMGMASH